MNQNGHGHVNQAEWSTGMLSRLRRRGSQKLLGDLVIEIIAGLLTFGHAAKTRARLRPETTLVVPILLRAVQVTVFVPVEDLDSHLELLAESCPEKGKHLKIDQFK
jgi:hypothetical protein